MPFRQQPRPRWFTRAGWGSLLFALSVGCSQPHETRVGTLGQSLAGGSIDPDSVAVYALEVGAPNPLLCSAVLVAPNLLLTARHCVSTSGEQAVVCGAAPLGELVEPSQLLASNVLSFLDAANPSLYSVSVERILVPSGSDVCGHDLAALLLTDSVADTPVPLGLRLDGAPEPGEPYAAVGYGHMNTNPGSRAGVRLRLPRQEVACVAEDCVAGDLVPSDIVVTGAEFVGSQGVCGGDSGGPAIDAEGKVLGIASRSGAGCTTPVYSSLPAFSDWLVNTLEAAAVAGGYTLDARYRPLQPEPEPNPEPAPTASAGAGGAASGSEGAALGEPCTSDVVCQADLVCAYRGAPESARCVERCTSDADCPSAQSCHEALEICEHTTARPSDSGCAQRAPGSPRASALVLLVALALGGARRRRYRG